MDFPPILILTETAIADDISAALAGLRVMACPPRQLPQIGTDAIVLVDLGRIGAAQAKDWIDRLRLLDPHLPVVLVLDSDSAPPEALLEPPLELLWRPLRPSEMHHRLRLLAGRTLRSSAAEGFRQVFERHHAMMLLINPASGQIVDANPAASRFYGHSRDALRRMRIQQINQLADAEVEQEIHKAHAEVANVFTFVHRLANGELRTVEVHSTPVEIEGQHLLFSILHDITSRRLAEEALRQSEEQYRQLFDLVPIGISVTSPDGRLLAFNEAMLQAGACKREDINSHSRAIDFYADPNQRPAVLERFRRDGFINRMEIHFRRLDGSTYPGLLTMAPIGFGGMPCMLVLIEDITERKRKDERIQKALNEREVLLREIHHRVKNNFQVIISLLNMQSRKLQDTVAVEPLIEMRNRIRSMALIHERIYHTDSLADVDFGDYLQYLTRELFSPTILQGHQIRLVFHLEQVLLDIDQAIPCGLLVNELLTNAFKYAFPPDWQGSREVEVRLAEQQGMVLLEVSDTGIGLPEAIDPEQPQSLGMQLIRQLVRQLEGSWTLTRSGGTVWTIRFGVTDPSSATADDGSAVV